MAVIVGCQRYDPTEKNYGVEYIDADEVQVEIPVVTIVEENALGNVKRARQATGQLNTRVRSHQSHASRHQIGLEVVDATFE